MLFYYVRPAREDAHVKIQKMVCVVNMIGLVNPTANIHNCGVKPYV